MPAGDTLLNALLLQIDAGADEAIAEAPIDRFALRREPAQPQPSRPSPPARAPAPPPATPVRVTRPAQPAALMAADTALGTARAAAAGAQTLAELRSAIEAFEGCALKETA